MDNPEVLQIWEQRALNLRAYAYNPLKSERRRYRALYLAVLMRERIKVLQDTKAPEIAYKPGKIITKHYL